MKRFDIVLFLIGISCWVVGRYIHIVDHPEWTQVQALLNLWMFWAAGFLFMLGAVLLMEMERHTNKLKKERDDLVKLNEDGDELLKKQVERSIRNKLKRNKSCLL